MFYVNWKQSTLSSSTWPGFCDPEFHTNFRPVVFTPEPVPEPEPVVAETKPESPKQEAPPKLDSPSQPQAAQTGTE